MKHVFLYILALIIISCSPKPEKGKNNKYQDLPVIEMSLTDSKTFDFNTRKIVFSPNNIATWMGRLILLSHDGTLYSTDINMSQPKLINKGNYKDIFAFTRKNAPGLFVALKSDGGLDAFLESDDEGNFKKISIKTNVEADKLKIKSLCPSNSPAKNKLKAISAKNKFVSFLVSIKEEKLRLDKMPEEKLDKSADCHLGVGDKYDYMADNNTLILLDNAKASHKIKLVDGLGIKGVDEVEKIFITNANFGTMYNKGVIVIIADGGKHIGLISLDYANNKKPKNQ